MPIVYDEAGARKSSKLLAPDDEFVGAFGDPFTVNRYLLSEIPFTEGLNVLSRSKNLLILGSVVTSWARLFNIGKIKLRKYR